jgi:hypothetical protein
MKCVNILQSQKFLPIVKLVTHKRLEAVTERIDPVYPHEPGVHVRLRLLVSNEGLWEKFVSQKNFEKKLHSLVCEWIAIAYNEGIYGKA